MNNNLAENLNIISFFCPNSVFVPNVLIEKLGVTLKNLFFALNYIGGNQDGYC